MILFDTLVVPFTESLSDRLGTRASSMIVPEQEAGTVAVSAISFPGFATMRRNGRLTSALPVQRWRGALKREDARR